MTLTFGHLIILFLVFLFVLMPAYGWVLDKIIEKFSPFGYWQYVAVGFLAFLLIMAALLVYESFGLFYTR